MTIIHVLNFAIPVAFMAFFGFWVDRMCKPEIPKQESAD